MADPYSTLGVARNASEKDIKSAYRKLAKELHPDRNKDNPKAAERFSEVTKAYDLLSDKDKRARFDRGEIDADGNPAMPFGHGFGAGGGGFRPGAGGARGFSAQDFEGFGGAEGLDIGDIFEGLFGGGRAGAGPGGMGGGFGSGAAGRRPPPPRKGANVQYRLRVPFADAATLKTQRITLADGKTIDLKLPAGVEDGTQMRLSGKGEPGPAGPGDALVTIMIEPHPFFRRDGDDVRLDLPVTLDEALQGAKVKVPTVDGAVMLTVAPGSGSGKVLRLKGKGFTKKGGGRGDQLVTLEIELPDDVRELAAKLDGWRDKRNVRAKLGV
jgi:DnaJ-class molecular chaperone